MKLLPAILCLCLSGFVSAETPWRAFKSADGSKSFVGQLVGFRGNDGTVSVRMKSTRQVVAFKLDRLSDYDQEYVKSAAPDLPVAAAIETRFTKIMDRDGTERADDTRTKTYNGGYDIHIRNFSPQTLKGLQVEYVVIYRKDAVDGLGERQTHKGSKHLSSLPPNIDDVVTADGIKLESFYKESSTSVVGSGCASCGTGGAAAIATKSQKRRDVLLGCIVRIKVDGKVVHTDASGPGILSQYEDAFDEPES